MPVLTSGLNVILGPGPQIQDIGPVYDLLLATRDGTTLPCKNKDGQVVNIAKLAFATTIDRNQTQHEETELQHKDQLVQLSSPNLIDREFNQWPQVSQGDWSDGTGQRVFTGATPVTGGTESDPKQYWDGLGLLWPTTDYLPVRAVRATPDQHESGAKMITAGVGTAGGALSGFSPPISIFVYMYRQALAPNNNILVIQGDGSVTTVTNPGGPSSGNNSVQTVDYIVALGNIWYLYSVLVGAGPAQNVVLAAITGGGAVVTEMTINNATLPNFSSAFSAAGLLAAGMIGNKWYVAFAWQAQTGSAVNIRILDISQQTFATFTDELIPLPVFSSPTNQAQQIEFHGNGFALVATTGSGVTVSYFDIISRSWSTLARFTNANAGYMCSINGSLFVLITNDTASNNEPNSVDMYLIQGGSVQHIGPLQIQGARGLSSFITGEGYPVAYGPYAIFPIYYYDGTSTHVAVYAYDVLRGRLFKLDDLSGYGQFLGNNHGPRMAVISSMQHPFQGGTSLAAQWGVAVPVLSANSSPQDITNVQRLLFGCSNGTFSSFQQPGTQIVSSLIDFTSAQLKLFRQVLVTWAQPGLPNESDITVTLDVWLDQDPASLNATPDFTTTVAGGAATVGQTQLRLRINQIATKLVYRVTTTSGVSGTTMTSAVKLIEVIVRAATGWTRTMMLSVADNAMPNGKGQVTIWQLQQPIGQPAVDAMVARDFLRQLWRLEGGECIAVFPGYDPPANWLLQDIHFDSPKPFGVSFRADQYSALSSICQLKLREDV